MCVLSCTVYTALDDQVSTSQQPSDHVREYSLAAMFYGLMDMCHRDFIREADGLGMMTMWRINMLRFWARKHINYLNIGHRLLAGSLM